MAGVSGVVGGAVSEDRVRDGRHLMNPLAMVELGILRYQWFTDRTLLLHDYTPPDADGTVAIRWDRWTGEPTGWSTPCSFTFWRNRDLSNG